MNEIESAIGTERIHTISRQSGSQAASGALAMSRQQVARALGSTGFVYVTGQLRENFETYLDRKPFEVEVGDLKPGMLADLASWASQEISGNPGQAQQAQARIRPEMAVKLLK